MRVKYISERVEAIPEKLLQYSIETWTLTPNNEYVVFALCTMCGEPWYLLCDDYYRADNIDSFPATIQLCCLISLMLPTPSIGWNIRG